MTITPERSPELRSRGACSRPHGDGVTTPTVAEGAVHLPDFGGYLNAVQRQDRSTDLARGRSRNMTALPAIHALSPCHLQDEIIIGGNSPRRGCRTSSRSYRDRAPIWITLVDSHLAAIVTADPVVVGEAGLSSEVPPTRTDQGSTRCQLRRMFPRSVVASQREHGSMLWKTNTVPPNSGPCAHSDLPKGAAKRRHRLGTPTIDPRPTPLRRETENYTVPTKRHQCQKEAVEHKSSDAGCTAPGVLRQRHRAQPRDSEIEWVGVRSRAGTLRCSVRTVENSAPPVPLSKTPDFDFGRRRTC